jgi:hypothetical protein
MYLRFTVNEIDDDYGRESGIFVVAYRLRNSVQLPGYQAEQLAEHLAWFESHLNSPSRFTTAKLPFYRKQSRAISWFKDTAGEHIARIRDIVRIVEDQGFLVTTLMTDRPGYVVYEDDQQIVAEPFADMTPRQH